LIEDGGIPLSSKIIDVGGGDSFLVDHLLDKGYTAITVLDISEAAIQRAKQRLGNRAAKATWIVSDVTRFKPSEKYDVWHDRAAFHFLTDPVDIGKYVELVEASIAPGGKLIVGTFSETGPKKCSGIDIKQYSQEDLTSVFSKRFTKNSCLNVDHETPFNTVQNFTFCSFKRID
jgi:2-polyprenyl-3-methyl-5-hydroxy-6-metoxy-1,4-benzoquinol methylase